MARKPPAKVYRSANGVSRIIRASYKGGARSEGWKEADKRLVLRDGDKCCKCGRSRKLLNSLGIKLQKNHIRMVARGGTDSDLNLQLECETCHAKNFKHDHLRVRKNIKKSREKAKKRRYYELTTGKKL